MLRRETNASVLAVVEKALRQIKARIVSYAGSIDLIGQSFRLKKFLNAREFGDRQRALQRVVATCVEEDDDRWAAVEVVGEGYRLAVLIFEDCRINR
jgi:hypothetical protein